MGCGACISACAYGAIEFRKTKHGPKAVVNPVLCKGDGLCNAKCPTGAIYLKHFTDDDLLYQIDAAAGEELFRNLRNDQKHGDVPIEAQFAPR
jgi:heterodisulfide reductase subunit A